MNTLPSLFKASSYTALLGWIVLIGFPSWALGTEFVLLIVITLLSLVYIFLVFFARKLDEGEVVKGSFWSLKGIVSLFKTPRIVLAGWVHYLAFDLMVGLYIVSDAANFDISHWLWIPCLLMTLMFGPAGLFIYFVLKYALTGEFLLMMGS